MIAPRILRLFGVSRHLIFRINAELATGWVFKKVISTLRPFIEGSDRLF